MSDREEEGEPTTVPDLTAEQAAEVIAAIGELRKSTKNVKQDIHGWHLEWTLRAKTRTGDLLALDPRDGKSTTDGRRRAQAVRIRNCGRCVVLE